MLTNSNYRKLVDDEQMIEYIRSFRETDTLSIYKNPPTTEEVIKHIEFVAKNEETFVSFILLCDRLDRKDKAFINLTAYHGLITSKDRQEYTNRKDYVDLFNSSLKEDGTIQGILKDAINYENKDKRDGKLLKI
jgi:hypothetical protein